MTDKINELINSIHEENCSSKKLGKLLRESISKEDDVIYLYGEVAYIQIKYGIEEKPGKGIVSISCWISIRKFGLSAYINGF